VQKTKGAMISHSW